MLRPMSARCSPQGLTSNVERRRYNSPHPCSFGLPESPEEIMHRAALGIRIHSGWGALVAVSHENGEIEILDRHRISITGTTDAGASQPYHAARNLQISEAETF